MIFTDRTIIVQKGVSSINNTIVLYRGDKDVEIRFTLNEGSPFKFGSGASPSIIEKTEASYGQLIIKTPNDLPTIFSEVAPTNEGKIIFKITGEMIDEIVEVGYYTFQIRLFDENRNSRATLPEVVNGIEIREPIATEDVSTSNEVGVATVGYAMTTAGTPEDAFDTQGNYNKTTWGTGDRITAAKLNKIEVAIDGVNKKVASGGTSGGVADSVDWSNVQNKPTIPTKTSQLTNDSGYITSIPDEYITETELNAKGYATTSQIPTVPTNVSELTNDAHYASETYVNNKIAEEQAKDINIFNPYSGEIIFGKDFASNGSVQDHTTWFISDYMEVYSSSKYIISNYNINSSSLWGYYQTYDENKAVVDKRFRFDSEVEIQFASNVKYIRITAPKQFCTDKGVDKIIVGKSDEVKGFIKYGYNARELNLIKENVQANFYNWYGKKLCAYGDSNTGKKMWQQYVIDKFGMIYDNQGVGGTTAVGRCTDEELAKIPLDTDVITIMFGTNDVSQHVPLGELPSFGIDENYEFDTTTYIGALCRMIQYISINIPTCRIILIAPLYRSNSKLNDVANEYPPFIGYINACEDIAKRFGCEFINMYQELGANMWNYGTYFLDESSNNDGNCWAVHLNELGGKRFAQKVINKLLEIEPIE